MAEETITTAPKRKLYNGEYRLTLDQIETPEENPLQKDAPEGDTSLEGPELSPEDKSWKKRYGDLRRHTSTLTERINKLENQLQAAQNKEIKIPSSKEELEVFAEKYPDVFRHIRSIAMAELLSERENLKNETKAVRDDLEKVKRERGFQKILKAHPDFEELNLSEEFH